MGKLIDLSVKLIRKYLPDPFVFAIILTVVAAVAAMVSTGQSPLEVVENWGGGVWSLLAFSMQMALVLVCGSALADAPLVKRALPNLLASIATRKNIGLTDAIYEGTYKALSLVEKDNNGKPVLPVGIIPKQKKSNNLRVGN